MGQTWRLIAHNRRSHDATGGGKVGVAPERSRRGQDTMGQTKTLWDALRCGSCETLVFRNSFLRPPPGASSFRLSPPEQP
jgi:hypothetical protein